MSQPVEARTLIQIMIKSGISLLGGIVLYAIWLAAFLGFSRLGEDLVELAMWLLAPVVTALGFAAGVWLMESRRRGRRMAFHKVFLWPLLGCALGAGAVYAFGPMLIVFGMLMFGWASVVIREIRLGWGRTNSLG